VNKEHALLAPACTSNNGLMGPDCQVRLGTLQPTTTEPHAINNLVIFVLFFDIGIRTNRVNNPQE